VTTVILERNGRELQVFSTGEPGGPCYYFHEPV
jgi:hypothetical protein